MTHCTTNSLEFTKIKNKKVVVNFNGDPMTSDAGVLLLREVDRTIKLTERIAKIMTDNRDSSKITHSMLSMLQQRVYGIALGYEDLNDHDELRKDMALQTALNRESNLASAPTLCRFENKSTRKVAVDIHKEMVEQFIRSYTNSPQEIILDFDATDDLVHGDQVGKFFHGYYGNYCFLPLYVFCGEHLLTSYLRPSNKDQALHAWAILSLLVKRIRQAWPNVKIIFRGDSGFCRHKMMDWCDKKNVFYIIGLPQNSRLKSMLEPCMSKAKKNFEATEEKQREFIEFNYAAKTWSHERKVIGKAEVTSLGKNPRFIVTNLTGDPQELYDNAYCARGDMENRIKEQQLGLFADRTSCHSWWPNQFRLLLSSLAYILVSSIRRYALSGTVMEKAQVGTIRLKLLKIGGAIIKNTRRIQFILSSAYPYKSLFMTVYERLVPG